MNNFIDTYLKSLIDTANNMDYTVIEKLLEEFDIARKTDKRIFALGNGGSASHANHFACDLGKNVTKDENGRFRVVSVCENMATLTAYANDIDYASVFSEQLKNYGLIPGDIIFAISASGNSPNVLSACEYGKSRGSKIISLTGFDGGKLKKMSDLSVHVKSNEYEKVEDLHMMVMHMIVSYFKKNGGNVQ